MPHNYRTSKNLDRILDKLFKKDKSSYEQVMNKIDEIINSYDVEHYKNLRHDLKDFKRVQVGHFVLIFKFNKTMNLVEFVDFDHHDNIYKKRF
ncbi:type II toxin-antitoxin system RelE/ParE family toxin [Candidatus Pacearchaeota archaeon]|nr:type II toxin-antitoxin system RelE/ParE family toxin [Candidatus Pacearchaeota archaeon]